MVLEIFSPKVEIMFLQIKNHHMGILCILNWLESLTETLALVHDGTVCDMGIDGVVNLNHTDFIGVGELHINNSYNLLISQNTKLIRKLTRP